MLIGCTRVSKADGSQVLDLQRDALILRKKRETLREAFDVLASMPEDFFAEGRQDPPPEVRERL